MKIHPDSIEGVRQVEQTKLDKAARTAEGFAGLLDQEVSKTSGSQAKPAAPILPPLVGRVFGTEEVAATAKAGEGQGDAAASLDGLMDRWENYAAGLGSGGNLKQAEAALQDIEAETGRVKEMAQDDPGLKPIADELEILAATERVKFNRGDYL
ncbi:hypothetical protein M7784_10355 [Desulfovibrio aminophilus]|nr:hypothetical protein [Desulfovibrio aminophilus]MCM0755645.1 hypothetical protein [Desulfovibrio aminophilus]